MLKKILIVCAPIAIFFVFLIIFVVSSGSKSPDVSPSPENGATENEDFTAFTEDDTEPAETEPKNTEIDFAAVEIIYDAPCTLEEIRSIFEKDRELFEKIKDIRMPPGYNYFHAAKSGETDLAHKIEFYGFDGAGGAAHVSYDIGETGEYSEIYEFFAKYGHIIGFIHTIDPDSAEYAGENLIAQFGLQMNVPVFSDHIPWAEIRYNRAAGEIEGEMTDEYIAMPLDDHWYYIYSNIYQK